MKHAAIRCTQHSLRVQRRQSIAWIAIVAVTGLAAVAGYRSAYPDTLHRQLLARSLQGNIGVQALYGVARRVDTVGGFTAWRLAWLLGPLLAIWALLASTALTRGEEETGRRELLLAAPVGARALLASDLAAVAIPQVVCGATFAVVLTVAGAPPGGAWVLATALVLVALLFSAIGATAAQLYPDRRHAIGVASAVLGVAFLVRVTADGTTTLGWLRSTTPFGWVENVHAFTGNAILPIGALLAATIAVTGLALSLSTHRDFGRGVVATEVRSRPDAWWFRGLVPFTLKDERISLTMWVAGIGAFACVFGLLAKDVAGFMKGQSQLRSMLAQLGVTRADRPQDFLGLMFTFFTLPLAIYGATQISGVRHDEATGRLHALLAQPIGRVRWLITRALFAGAGIAVLAVVAGLGAWAGAAMRDSGVGWRSALGAGVNCATPAVLFVGIGLCLVGLLPRIAPGATLGAIVVLYLLLIVGELVDVPSWVLWVSPFHHVAPVPAAPANEGAAIAMTAGALLLAIVGVGSWRHRDLISA